MERKAFGKLADGEEATLYTISVSYTHLTLPTT